MKTNQWSSVIVLSLAASTSVAQSYQADVSASYSRSSQDQLAFDPESKEVSGRWFFNAVDTADHPLAEAAFLERSSSAALSFANIDLLVGSAGLDADGNFVPYQIKGTAERLKGEISYYVPNTFIYMEAEYYVMKSSVPEFNFSDSTNSWGATLGVAPLPGLLILTRYFDASHYRFNVETQYVTKLIGGRAVRLEANYFNGELRDRISVGADYYFDRTWSVGGWLNTSSDTGVRLNTSDNGVGLRTRKFMGDRFSVAGSIYKFGSFRNYSVDASLRI